MIIAPYCRVSTDHRDQLNSLKNQKEFFETYAKQNNHTIYKIYADEGITGTSLRKREAFKQLMRDAEQKPFDIVVVKDISRFARNTVDLLQNIRTLKSYGINTVFLTANMDSMGDSEFLLTIFGAIAQEESANLSKRIKWGKKITAEKGRVPNHIYGYDHIDTYTLRINEEEASVVRDIFRMYVQEGMGSRTISAKLNTDGKTTKYGHEWNPRGVRKILSSTIYYGHYTNHKCEVKNFLTGERADLPEEESFSHDNNELAIISKEDFDAAQKTMAMRLKMQNITKENCSSGKGSRYSNKHAFSSIIKCSECGRSFVRYTKTYKNTHHYWSCSTNYSYSRGGCPNRTILKENELIDALRGYLNGLIKNREEFVQSVADAYIKGIPKLSIEESEAKLLNRKESLAKRRKKYQEMYANDAMTISELKECLGEIDAEVTCIDDALTGNQKLKQAQSTAKENAKELLDKIDSFLSLEEVNNQDIRNIIDHIEVDKDKDVTFYLRKLSDL